MDKQLINLIRIMKNVIDYILWKLCCIIIMLKLYYFN